MNLSARLRTAAPAALLAGLLVVSVAGCSSSGGGSGSDKAAGDSTSTPKSSAASGSSTQTKTEACSLIKDSVQKASSEMTASTTKISTDPEAAIAAIQKLSTAFQKTESQVTEPGAADVVKPAGEDLKAFAKAAQTIKSDPQGTLKKLQDLSPTMQKDFAAVGTYCS